MEDIRLLKHWKKYLLIILFCSAVLPGFGQVSIGILTPNPSAQLDVTSTTRGVLLSRMTEVQRNAINNPANGLVVYCVDCKSSAGFYVYDTTFTPDVWLRVGNTLSADATFNANSDSLVPSQKAVKTYVDNQGGLIVDTRGNHRGSSNENLAAMEALSSHNVALGAYALALMKTGNNNIGIGSNAGKNISKASSNIAIGGVALFSDTTGSNNVAIGNSALFSNGNGSLNVAIGPSAGRNNKTNNNTIIGANAGFNSEGAQNVYLGYSAGYYDTAGVGSVNGNLFIENTNTNTPLIGGDFNLNKVGINIAVDSLNNANRATLQVGGDMSLQNGVAVNEFSTDGTLGDSSDIAIPTEAAVKAYVDGKGYLTSFIEVDGSVTNEIQNLDLSGTNLNIDGATGVDLTPFMDNTDNQSLSKIGDTIKLANGGYVLDSVLTEAEVDAYVANNNYLTSFTEADGSVTNEIQNLDLSGTNLNIDGATGVDLTSFMDNTDNQQISKSGLTVTLEDGGSFTDSVDNLGNHQAIQNLDLATHKLVGNGGDDGVSIQNDGKVKLTYGNVAVNELSTDASLGSANASDTTLVTEKAIKTYVDNNKGLFMDDDNNMKGSLTANLVQVVASAAVHNIALGSSALNSLKTGRYNIGLGANAGQQLLGGHNNIAIGISAMLNDTNGSSNVVIGNSAAFNNYNGSYNVMLGQGAGQFSKGGFNTIVGHTAGFYSGGTHNVYLGFNAGYRDSIGVGSDNGNLFIENSATNTPLIGGDFGYNKVGINIHVDSLYNNNKATLQVGGDLSLQNGVAVNEFSTDGTLSGNSDVTLPTEKAVKTYVDNIISEPSDNLGNHKAEQNLDLDTYKLVGNGGSNGVSIANDGGVSLTTGQAINEFSTDGTLSGNSDLAVPTEKAVKAYFVSQSGKGLLNTGSDNISGNNNNFDFVTTGNTNTAIGNNALNKVTTGFYNLAIGNSSLESVTTGHKNLSIGIAAGSKTTTGAYNVFVGGDAGWGTTTGSFNTFVGKNAGESNSTGDSNVFIGYDAGRNNGAFSNRLIIENSNTTTPLIGGDFANDRVGINRDIANLSSGATFQVGGTASKNTAGDWLANSDYRLKKNINYLNSEDVLNKLLEMKGVTYNWNDTVTGTPRPETVQYGFIAQDIQQVWPDNISEDGQGYLMTPYGTYDAVYVESIKALYQRITELEEENGELKTSLSKVITEQQNQRNEMAEMKKQLQGLSSSEIYTQK